MTDPSFLYDVANRETRGSRPLDCLPSVLDAVLSRACLDGTPPPRPDVTYHGVGVDHDGNLAVALSWNGQPIVAARQRRGDGHGSVYARHGAHDGWVLDKDGTLDPYFDAGVTGALTSWFLRVVLGWIVDAVTRLAVQTLVDAPNGREKVLTMFDEGANLAVWFPLPLDTMAPC